MKYTRVEKAREEKKKIHNIQEISIENNFQTVFN